MTRLLMVALLVGLVGCRSQEPAAEVREGDRVEAPKGTAEQGLVLTDTDGKEVPLDAALARGEHVALVFWATWCANCAKEAPAVVRGNEEHGDAIRFVSVISGRDEDVDDAKVEAKAKAWGYTAFPRVRDRDLELSRVFGVDGTPTIVVLGKDREVLFHSHDLPSDWAKLRGAKVVPQ